MVSRFQATPRESHVQAMKIIFKYLKGTMDLGLWYPSKESFSLRAYSDVDWLAVMLTERAQVEEHFFGENHMCLG